MRYATLAAAAVLGFLLAPSASEAQVVYVTRYAAPPVVVAPQPVVTYRPVVPVTAYSPVIPTTSVVAPAVPAPVVATPVVTTRYRPILGGTVSRVRYRYTPAVVAY